VCSSARSAKDAVMMSKSPWRITAWVCGGVICLSVFACLALAAMRSSGLVAVKVTALDEAAEPRDPGIPVVGKKISLPDYEVTLMLRNGAKIYLGAKPDTSAVEGLTWRISDPVSLSDIASVRLREQDKVVSDAIAEVHVSNEPVTENGYRFEFTSEHSFGLGIQSFFQTPVGKAIGMGFLITVVVLGLAVFRL
jgi:hypothetical protein